MPHSPPTVRCALYNPDSRAPSFDPVRPMVRSEGPHASPVRVGKHSSCFPKGECRNFFNRRSFPFRLSSWEIMRSSRENNRSFSSASLCRQLLSAGVKHPLIHHLTIPSPYLAVCHGSDFDPSLLCQVAGHRREQPFLLRNGRRRSRYPAANPGRHQINIINHNVWHQMCHSGVGFTK
ncbi:MAG: hypothetical protein RLY31_2890 [Bacteroidota bacterium]|jgi:hypothetical protein